MAVYLGLIIDWGSDVCDKRINASWLLAKSIGSPLPLAKDSIAAAAEASRSGADSLWE